jgi:hypothetical protein
MVRVSRCRRPLYTTGIPIPHKRLSHERFAARFRCCSDERPTEYREWIRPARISGRHGGHRRRSGFRGRYREETLDAGDVGYIPQGYGHSIENVGSDTARVLIAFNSGSYETIDLSQLLAAQPADVLVTNFGRPAAAFDAFPRADVFISGD